MCCFVSLIMVKGFLQICIRFDQSQFSRAFRNFIQPFCFDLIAFYQVSMENVPCFDFDNPTIRHRRHRWNADNGKKIYTLNLLQSHLDRPKSHSGWFSTILIKNLEDWCGVKAMKPVLTYYELLVLLITTSWVVYNILW